MAVLTQTIPQISIEGFSLDDYIVADIALYKELLRPSRMEFDIRRKSIMRSEGDVRFDIASRLLGSRIQMEIQTQRRDVGMDDVMETLTFSGIVFGVQNTRSSVGNAAYYHVTAYSPDYLLVDNPHCASFEDMSLTEIITKSISDYRGTIKADMAPRLTARLPYTVQYNETTYQFISRLAQRYGEFLFFDNDELYFGQTPSGKSVKLHPDTDVLGYSYSLNMEHTELRHAQHDYIRHENSVQNGYDNAREAIHDLTDTVYAHSHSAYRKRTLQDIHSTSQEYSSFSQNQVSSTVEGWGQKSRMMTCTLKTNRADICIGDRITIQETADEGGLSLIDHQELMAIGVECHATIDGHFENTVTAIPSDAPYPPYGQTDLYPICESQRAVVVDNADPEHLGRIRVKFLWQELQPGMAVTPWLRITQPHGGDDKGFYFIPEIGEEVMVAFENGNGEKPYIVGTLYHGRQHPGAPWPNGTNNVKAIRTRNGHTVEIHDEGDGGYIRIYDYDKGGQKENYILTFSTDEKLIRLQSKGNIELYADNDIIMQAGHDISVVAGNDERRDVGRNRDTHIGSNDTLMVDANKLDTVGANRYDTINANHQQVVAVNQIVKVGGDRTTAVTNTDKLSANDRVETIEDESYLKAKTIKEEAGDKINQEAKMEVNIKALKVKLN
jgi:uncharacterized protein involved in type VI secretion and phage assembly